MKNIQELLDRGFGLLSINDCISLTYCENEMQVHFAALPGTDDTTDILVNSRSVSGILHEIHDYFTQYIAWYYDLISTDLINM